MSFTTVGELDVKDTDTNKYLRVAGVDLARIQDSAFLTYIVFPADTRLSTWPELVSGKVEGAEIYNNNAYKVNMHRFVLPDSAGIPWNPVRDDLQGPAYWNNRHHIFNILILMLQHFWHCGFSQFSFWFPGVFFHDGTHRTLL